MNHHALPIEDLYLCLAEASDTSKIETAYRDLSSYLDLPIGRMALQESNDACSIRSSHVRNWEYKLYTNDVSERHEMLVDAIIDHIKSNKENMRRYVPSSSEPNLRYNDTAHYCGFVIRKDMIDMIIESFNSFIIQGLPTEAPYFVKKLKKIGKRYAVCPTLDKDGRMPNINEKEFECVVQTVSWTQCNTDLPVIKLVHGSAPGVKNFPAHVKLPDDLVDPRFDGPSIAYRYVRDPSWYQQMKAEMDQEDI